MSSRHISAHDLPASDASGLEAALADLPTWRLEDLYEGPDSRVLAQDLDRLTVEAEDFSRRYKGQLSGLLKKDGGGALAQAIGAYEALEDGLGKIMSYAGLLYASDNLNSDYGKFYGDTGERVTNITATLLFFTLELNRLGEDALAEGLADPALAYYGPWLRDVRAMRPYQLSDDVERLFHEKTIVGRTAWNRLFDETMARMRFSLEGKEQTVEVALDRLSDSDRGKRQDAAEALAQGFGQQIEMFSLLTNTLAKDKEVEDRWRGFEDLAGSRHVANRVEGQVVEALTQAVEASYESLSHRYYKLKAGWLGLERLEHWDRNAPLPGADQTLIPWAQAQALVLEAFGDFDPRLAEIGGQFFDKGWIDAGPRVGKAPGAFSHPTVPSAHPYILLNYMGKTRDVMTLAHELGHGVHQVLAGPQGALMADTPLTLAETASVFGEMLTFRKLLKRVDDGPARKALLAGKVEDMLNTVVRQIAFYVFERRVHGARRDGELTARQIGEIWLDVARESLGPSVHLAPGYETFWCYIPHFIHSPFYVYAYAFGDCLVNALYGTYEREPDGFADKYLEMLKAGGSLRHKELLAPFGLDAGSPSFWDRGLCVIGSLIDELEAM